MAGKIVDEGDKIYLPPSALDKLVHLNIEYPMLFEITNETIGKKTHCGVLEFSADEGWCHMPFWMMQNLLIEEGSLINCKNVSLGKASFVKLRAHSCDFLEVSNPRALLEVTLRKFTCLTVGDAICIPYNGKNFYLDVREVQPNGAASIIETDCNVDFEEPLGYKDSKYAQYERDAAAKRERSESLASGGSGIVDSLQPRQLQKAKAATEEAEAAANATVFKAFGGTAQRIDGKRPPSNSNTPNKDAKSDSKTEAPPASSAPIVKPAFSSKIGNKYSTKKNATSAFQGKGNKLA